MNNNTTIKIPKPLLERIKTIRRLKAAKDNNDALLYDVLLEMVEDTEKKYKVKEKK